MSPPEATDIQETKLEPVLKDMSITLRLLSLYPPQHPVPEEALERLHAKIKELLQENETLQLEVSKEKISAFGKPLAEGNKQVKNLSFHLFSRGIAALSMGKDLSKEELRDFFLILTDNPEICRGKLSDLLIEKKISNVVVEELALNTIDAASVGDLPSETDEKDLSLDALYDLVKSGNIPHQLKRKVLFFFRGTPSQISSILTGLSIKASFDAKDYTVGHRSKFIHNLLDTLSPLISEEPQSSQEHYYQNLASAQLLLDEPLKKDLFGNWILPESQDKESMAGKIVKYLNDTELTDIVLSQITGGENAERMLHLLQTILLSQQERTNFMALLKEELSKIKYGEHDLLSLVGLKSYLRINEPLEDEPLGDETIEITLHYAPEKMNDEKRKELQDELNLQSRESFLQVHFCRTLLEALSLEENEEHQKEITRILANSINQIISERRYAEASKLLFSLSELKFRDNASPHLSGLIELMTEDIAQQQTLKLMALLFEAGESQQADEIRECLKLLGAPAVTILLDALASEKEMKKRKIICYSLGTLSQDLIDTIGAKIEDKSEWYVVRNIVSIMGQAKSSKATEYLEKTITHPDSRVRSETISAIAGIKGSRATAILTQALKDPDLKIACKAAKQLGARKAEQSVPELLNIVRKFDPFGRIYELKTAAIESLGRIGSPLPLPTLKKLSHRRSILNASQAKLLSQEAGRAVILIEKAQSDRREDVDAS